MLNYHFSSSSKLVFIQFVSHTWTRWASGEGYKQLHCQRLEPKHDFKVFNKALVSMSGYCNARKDIFAENKIMLMKFPHYINSILGTITFPLKHIFCCKLSAYKVPFGGQPGVVCTPCPKAQRNSPFLPQVCCHSSAVTAQ